MANVPTIICTSHQYLNRAIYLMFLISFINSYNILRNLYARIFPTRTIVDHACVSLKMNLVLEEVRNYTGGNVRFTRRCA